MRLKVFSSTNEEELEDRVNDWLAEQGVMIEVENTHFSTSSYSAAEGEIATSYSVAIWYQNL